MRPRSSPTQPRSTRSCSISHSRERCNARRRHAHALGRRIHAVSTRPTAFRDRGRPLLPDHCQRTGEGMTESTLARIFEPPSRPRRSERGPAWASRPPTESSLSPEATSSSRPSPPSAPPSRSTCPPRLRQSPQLMRLTLLPRVLSHLVPGRPADVQFVLPGIAPGPRTISVRLAKRLSRRSRRRAPGNREIARMYTR